MYIFNGPIGYDETTGNVYVNPEMPDAILIGELPKGLSAKQAQELLLEILSDPEGPWNLATE